MLKRLSQFNLTMKHFRSRNVSKKNPNMFVYMKLRIRPQIIKNKNNINFQKYEEFQGRPLEKHSNRQLKFAFNKMNQ
jgi:hypothetical protein